MSNLIHTFRLIALLAFAISAPAYGEFGSLVNPGSNNTNKGGSNDQNDFLNQLDEDLNNSIDQVDNDYKNSTSLVDTNQASLDNYLNDLDRTYDAQVADINNGGTGKISEPLPTYNPLTAEQAGLTNGSNSASGSSIDFQNGTVSGSSTAEPEAPTDPRTAMLDKCPDACERAVGLRSDRVCLTECARTVVLGNDPENGFSPRPQEDNSLAMMLLLMMNQ